MIYELRERVIYKIKSPTNRIYIGQSCKFKDRMSSYKNLHCSDQPKIYNSILKYGFNNHEVEILFNNLITQDGIDDLEIAYIKFYNANSKDNLNVCSGGKGHAGHLHTQESKDKMSKAKQGYKPWNTGVKRTEEQNKAFSEMLRNLYKDKTKHGRYGKVLSEETKQKIRDSLARTRKLKKDAEQVNNDI